MNTSPRGLRNNNPLNIRRSTARWLGEVSCLNGRTDTAFCQFTDLQYGYRAAAKLLRTYQRKYGCRTIKQIINRWAPPHENSTTAYIAQVARLMSAQGGQPITPDQPINLSDPETLQLLICAMQQVECGQAPTLQHINALHRAIAQI